MLVPEGLVGLHRPFNFSLFGINGWGIDLDYCGIEWFALEMNRDHSAVIDISPKDCISESFVDYNGYTISSKGFLPTVSQFSHSVLSNSLQLHGLQHARPRCPSPTPGVQANSHSLS